MGVASGVTFIMVQKPKKRIPGPFGVKTGRDWNHVKNTPHEPRDWLKTNIRTRFLRDKDPGTPVYVH